MLPVIAWKVYCADGSIHTANPEAIPQNVQVVIYYHEPPYRTLAYGDDTYNVMGQTISGSWMVEEDYLAMVDTALADTEIPK